MGFMFSVTKVVTPHNPQQSWPPAGQTHRLFLATHVSGGLSCGLTVGGECANTGGVCAKLRVKNARFSPL